MAKINLEFIERFQLEYQKNPRSRVFASLAEAYRKMGYLDEAFRISTRGTQIHPAFAGGRVAFAKVLIDMKQSAEALEQLEKAIELSPENLLAHSLMGEVLLELRRPKDALKSFKMVLFLNPNDAKAKAAVGKWEFLSADEYEDELFAMKPVFALDSPSATAHVPLLHPESQPEEQRHDQAVERALSLADAFTVRGETEKALSVLADASRRIGPNSEIEKRYDLLVRRAKADRENAEEFTDEPEDEFDLHAERSAQPLIDSFEELRSAMESNTNSGLNSGRAAPRQFEMEETVSRVFSDEMFESINPKHETNFGTTPNLRVETHSAQNYGVDPREKKRMKLETFLQRIEARRAR